ncbi:MAG: TIGR02646 family protein [Prevotellaceae bacterium]|jgi:uncharacterized protein (TIGR02646 family)|nr:TIGR02646 family protein [Prevotellaceae bacterium]
MKKINKGDTPDFFTDYIKQHHPKKWEDIGAIRQKLRDHIIKEQGNYCAYTEIRPSQTHIDHFRKRDHFPQDTFNYENLFVSCTSDKYGANHKDRHVKPWDYAKIINPALDDPSEYIEFIYTGVVIAKDERGQTTIDMFNLNEPTLVERRKKSLLQMKDMYKEFDINQIIEFIGEFPSMLCQLYP